MAKCKDSGYRLLGQPVILKEASDLHEVRCFGVLIGEYDRDRNNRFRSQKHVLRGDTTCCASSIYFDGEEEVIEYICNPPENAWILDSLRESLEDAGLL